MMMKRMVMVVFLMALAIGTTEAQNATDTSLKRHDFFYAGQSKQRRMFIVKDGQVSWAYQDGLKRGEISDAYGAILRRKERKSTPYSPLEGHTWCSCRTDGRQRRW